RSPLAALSAVMKLGILGTADGQKTTEAVLKRIREIVADLKYSEHSKEIASTLDQPIDVIDAIKSIVEEKLTQINQEYRDLSIATELPANSSIFLANGNLAQFSRVISNLLQ